VVKDNLSKIAYISSRVHINKIFIHWVAPVWMAPVRVAHVAIDHKSLTGHEQWENYIIIRRRITSKNDINNGWINQMNIYCHNENSLVAKVLKHFDIMLLDLDTRKIIQHFQRRGKNKASSIIELKVISCKKLTNYIRMWGEHSTMWLANFLQLTTFNSIRP